MTVRLRRSVVLVGLMGAGKTAVGGALARLFGVSFTDSDASIEDAANQTIAEIFSRHGEAFFREKESRVIGRLMQGSPGVISTGGGVFLSAANRETISRGGVSVWLRAHPDLLWARVKGRGGRPLLASSDPRGTLIRLAEERRTTYELADMIVDAEPDLSVEAMAQKVRGVVVEDGRATRRGPGDA